MKNSSESVNELDADVLVLGGGPAATWAAISARNIGASVILADKGFCGASGATAAAGTGLWFVGDDTDRREFEVARLFAAGGFLAETKWMHRVLDLTRLGVDQLVEWGYPFPIGEDRQGRFTSLQGPEYMRLMRKQVKAAGVRILDQSPALELIINPSGAASGALGVHRQPIGTQRENWLVRAGAVVMATGGCAFLGNALGCNPLTGDGLLMSAEVGAELSGMEFSNMYGLAPQFSSVTKSLLYNWASFYKEDGTELDRSGGLGMVARALQTGPVYARLDRAGPAMQPWMRNSQPNFFLPFDRRGLDPFIQRFPITLRLEGSVRGTGGLRLVDETCATTVPGLFAAGDVATRELICGATTGGGAPNAAWAMSSGSLAGAGAARFALTARRENGYSSPLVGGVGLRMGASPAGDCSALVAEMHSEVFPLQKNMLRSESGMAESLNRLDDLWARMSHVASTDGRSRVRARETAAMLAASRWMYRSAMLRRESRGMHVRSDFPTMDMSQAHRILCGGLDDIWTKPQQPVVKASRQPRERSIG